MHMFPVLSLLPVLVLCIACAQAPDKPAAGALASARNWTAQAEDGSFEERARRMLAGSAHAAGGLDEGLLYKFLLAEIAGQRGNLPLAAQTYLELARTTKDAGVARRATEIALYAQLNEIALESAKIWLAAEGDSPAARQTLATLLVNSRNLDAARPLLAEALAAERDNPGQALLQLHGVLSRHPDKGAVHDLVADLTGPYRKHAEAHYVIAQAAQAAGRHGAAQAAIGEALRIRPDWAAAALLHAQLLARDAQERSLDYLSQYLLRNPESQEVRLAFARNLINEKRYEEARGEFQKLLAANPDNADIALTVAFLSLQMNDVEAADVQLKRALELGYQDPDTIRFQLGQVNEDLKRLEEAGRWYRAVSGGAQYVVAQARYALLLARQQQLDEARAHLQNLAPQNEAQRVQLVQAEAHLLREVRQYDESYQVLRDALDVQPDHPDLLYDIALAAEKLDRLDVVEASLRKLIAMKPDHAQAYNALGYTLADRTDRLTEAYEYIEQALRLAPDDPFILDSMGWVHYRLGNLQEGLGYLRRAYEQRRDPEIAAHLGEVLWAKGKREEAEAVWRESLRDNPESDELRRTMRRFLE
jgi:tetratricopeptide (TPR) repeat protein